MFTPLIFYMVVQNIKSGKIDILGLGEIVIDLLLKIPRFPSPDEKLYVLNSEKQAGGVTANFCVGVARQGLRVAFIGAVGNDEEGTYLRKILQKEGIHDSYLLTLESKVTPVNIVMVTKDGEKAILQSEHMRLTLPPAEFITPEIVQNARHLHLTAINFETALKTVKLAKEANLTVSLDLESQVVEEYLEEIPKLLKYVDLLLPNKGGAFAFTQIENNPQKASLKLLDYGPKVIIMTLGVEGVLFTTGEDQTLFPAFRVDNVIDTTGAGDAFNAGFITAFLNGFQLEESIKRGQATAALKIQGTGAQKPLPTTSQLEFFLDKRSGTA
ncbi:MAG: carbohydrate kinase family protein [Candidatus Hodarchaeota archaeon]